MLENIRLSMKGIWSHKLRSFLTMLGIIIGIAAIIAIVSTIKGTNKQIEDNLIGDGTNTVTVQLYQDGWAQDYNESSSLPSVPQFSKDVKKQILNIEGTERVSMYHKAEYASSLFYKNKSLDSASIYGIDEDYLETEGLQIVSGRAISSQDIKKCKKVVLVDQVVIDSAFGGESPIGKTMDIKGEPFTVVGVVEKKSEFEPVINSEDEYYTYKQSSNGAVYIPDSLWPVIYQYDVPSNFLVKAKSTSYMTSVGKETQELLNSYLSSENSTVSYKANDLAQEASQLQQLSSSTNLMLIGIASISLLVGGIGVMNIMLVSVTERTREIGLKKALGAKRRTIRMQFLTEAAMLSILGGLFGVIAGIILSQVMAAMASIPVAISVPAILISVGFSMVIGIVFGIMPSIKASNLNPIEALRYE